MQKCAHALMCVALMALSPAGGLAQTSKAQDKPTGKKPAKSTAPKSVKTRSGLEYVDLKIGKGAVAKPGQQVTVHYVGTLKNGTKFDSSRDHGSPFTFKLGAHKVIKGWDEGVANMRVGGKRKLIVPPDLAYGDQGVGTIPPNSVLLFEVELLAVK